MPAGPGLPFRSRAAAAILWPLALLLPLAAAGADLKTCDTAALTELGAAMEAHNKHVYRMDRKFKDVWYFQGEVPPAVGKAVSLDSVRSYLKQLAPRRPALLFHATDAGRLCTWLVTPERDVVRHVRKLAPGELDELDPQSWQELGVRSARQVRAEDPGQIERLTPQDSSDRWSRLLSRLGALLLPQDVQRHLVDDRIDTLIVVPISVREFAYGREQENDSATQVRSEKALREMLPATRFVLAVGTVPFLALPLGAGQLVDRMSVIVAPGFLPFAGSPYPARAPIRESLVVGAPVRKGLAPLPGAQAEVEQIAGQLGTTPIVLDHARKARVLDELARRGDRLDFILIATHGRASEANPIDQSYLAFSDERLTAREISRFRQGSEATASFGLKQRPVVVMSACETGLGKSFAVGTIGLARAWQWAGASNVVMSLWSVDDEATRAMMVDLVQDLRNATPVDRALRDAALKARVHDPNPAFWAGFSVFGAPERVGPR